MSLASNLAAARHQRGLSLADLATSSAVSKSTLHEIERGTANPRLDTLYAIATALDLNLSDLIADAGPTMEVTRAGDGAMVTGDSVTARLLHRLTGAGAVEVFETTLGPELQESEPHRRGTTECLIVHDGTVEIGVDGLTVQLGPGDSAWFATDAPHTYRSIDGTATATLLVSNAAVER